MGGVASKGSPRVFHPFGVHLLKMGSDALTWQPMLQPLGLAAAVVGLGGVQAVLHPLVRKNGIGGSCKEPGGAALPKFFPQLLSWILDAWPASHWVQHWSTSTGTLGGGIRFQQEGLFGMMA